ncbi:hypothetical protein SBA3_2640011 [Candidatus Sulfopaludibacter sp. SbA3]|nr:hypothetical protein SBA3_2640011 [Candidatus Sulfopaludibacter sp. SbA3]
MYQDYKDLLSAFHAHGVRYLIVGGYAVIFHAQPRFTNYIEVFIKADPANARAVDAALSEFRAPLQNIRPEEFAQRSSFFRFGRDPRGIDILADLPGVDFDTAWERRQEGVIDPRNGSSGYFGTSSTAPQIHRLGNAGGLAAGFLAYPVLASRRGFQLLRRFTIWVRTALLTGPASTRDGRLRRWQLPFLG